MSVSAYTHRHPLCRHIISAEFALVCLNKQTHTSTHVHRGLERDSVIMCRHQSAGKTRKPLSTQRACHKKNNTSRIRHVSRIMNILLAKRSWLQFGRAPLSPSLSNSPHTNPCKYQIHIINMLLKTLKTHFSSFDLWMQRDSWHWIYFLVRAQRGSTFTTRGRGECAAIFLANASIMSLGAFGAVSRIIMQHATCYANRNNCTHCGYGTLIAEYY